MLVVHKKKKRSTSKTNFDFLISSS